MSKTNRLDWSKQITLMNERIKHFQAEPGQEQLDAVIAELKAYAEAARNGGIEIPSRFTVN
ncbi:hypothetical protein SAMN05216319_2691 [Duganella sp. CF402]|uniref:hypothetical protein n=1 Tax=unclassified Duganella TaxID=2636909 RepID=UPI0008BB0210|nr:MULTISPECIES: hypothetical protein [unclassified Duganella]RZT08891.1 hypothetical protein EV582_0930 [Duganella sp. BK701]SEL77841.1 hypothetical protein SAMN05216319_2691 [Duganella sp. CF402]